MAKKGQVSEKTLKQQQTALTNTAGRSRTEINARNREFGKSIERNVSKLWDDANRIPGSGAFKTSNLNLKGDVSVKDQGGRRFVKIECKGSSVITPKGRRTFTLEKDVIDQTLNEALEVGELPMLWIHWENATYATEDHVIVPGKEGEAHWLIPSSLAVELVRLAQIGHNVENS